MHATKTILLLGMGATVEERAGAAAYHTSSDDEMIARAVANLRKVFSPRLLYRFSVMVLNRHQVGLGEIHLMWSKGRLDTLTETETHKAHLLEEQSLFNS